VVAFNQEPALPTVAEPKPEATPSESAAPPKPAPADAPPATADADTQDPDLAAAEAELMRRYPNHRIKPGSLRPAGADPAFGHKRTVTIVCPCGAERTLATSDLFHVQGCPDCARAARRATRRVEK
jgi:hypothetical protein